MYGKNYNNDFFSWQGNISRKDYTINVLIVFALFVVLSFVNFQAFSPYVPIKFLLTILTFMAYIIKLVLVMAFLSLVYRRISDFVGTKPYKFQLTMKRLFVFLYVVPVFYLLVVRYFLSIMPVIINIADLVVFFVLIPFGLISTIVFAFIKGIKYR